MTDKRVAMLDGLVEAVTDPKRRHRFQPWEMKFLKSVKDSFSAYGRLTDRQWEVIENMHRGRIDFERVERAALSNIDALVSRWLPGGKTECGEYTALNPKRADRNLGSFKVNLSTGAWCDFAYKDTVKGTNLIDLAAYLFDMKPTEAAEEVSNMLGVSARNGR